MRERLAAAGFFPKGAARVRRPSKRKINEKVFFMHYMVSNVPFRVLIKTR